jgi:hypothetical protein
MLRVFTANKIEKGGAKAGNNGDKSNDSDSFYKHGVCLTRREG